MTLPPGTVIAGYLIERVLGSGGMGTVYLARHPSLPRHDALKVLSAEYSAEPSFRARFNREAELAATLDHPNIVRIYSRGETEDGRLWIAMQYVDGTDARQAQAAGPMPIPRILHIISEVAKALDYAHSRNLLHRDVKPANFLLSGPPGPHERVLLADFGIARALDDANRLTATGVMMATVAYAPPEAIEGRPLDGRSDIYSLGCSLYRMLTGVTPYAGADSMAATMLAHVSQPPPRVTEMAPGLPPAIDAVIATAMAKDPALRYQSARDLAAAASAALLGATSVAAPGAAGAGSGESGAITYPEGYFTAPNQTGPPPAGIAPGTPFPPHPGAAPAAARGIPRRWIIAGAGAVALALVGGGIAAVTNRSSLPPYQAKDFAHTFGTTRLDQRPDAVATLGPGDADVALSLGIQPRAMVLPGGRIPGWLQDLVHGSPRVMAKPDTAELQAAKPDAVIDTTAGLTRELYDALTPIAPTITRPAGDDPFTPTRQLSWIADILGAQDRVNGLREAAAQAEGRIRSDNPTFSGTQIVPVSLTDAGLSVELSDSPIARYLNALGFTHVPKFQSKPGDGATEKPITADDLSSIDEYVTVVIRSDKGAGSGGFAGLPSRFEYLPGPVVIVDEPDTVAAMLTCGPAATRYLDENFVPKLAQQIK